MREAYHEVDTFDNVNFAVIRPLWPFAPKCWPHLRQINDCLSWTETIDGRRGVPSIRMGDVSGL
jgi:hypothetical protein